MADPILDLSTILPDRDSVRIDGHPYEIARQDDLSLEQRRDVNKTWSRLLEIEQKEEFTPTDETEYSDLVQKLTNLVLIDCPRHIVKKLPRSAKESIILGFFGQSKDPRMVMAFKQIERVMMENQSTGDSPSPDSNVITEEIPSNGQESQ